MTTARDYNVVAARNASGLLSALGHFRHDVHQAVEDGLLARAKVGGWWIYAPDSADISLAQRHFSEAVEQLVYDWFVANPLIAGKAASKTIQTVRIGPGASDAFMRTLVSEGSFGLLPVFNQSYLPYLAVHAHERTTQVTELISEIGMRLEDERSVARADLPEPTPAPSIRPWRQLLLGHAEYLALGHLEGDVLVPWGGS